MRTPTDRPGTEQAATDCRWRWATPKRSERRVWEVKTQEAKKITKTAESHDAKDGKAVKNEGGGKEGEQRKISRGDVNQLLGQVEVEQSRARKARLYGCLLDPATEAMEEAIAAARNKIRLVNHAAAVRLYDLPANRLRQYAVLCGDGSAEARGEARTRVEHLLPADGWLARLLAPGDGRVLLANDVEALFPTR